MVMSNFLSEGKAMGQLAARHPHSAAMYSLQHFMQSTKSHLEGQHLAFYSLA